MPLPAFLKRASKPDTSASTPAPPAVVADAVATARTRARRRLIGAAVLLAVGVIAFPLLFETQPRPIPVDLPIEIPRKDAVPALPPPPRSAAQPAPTAEPASAPAMAAPAPVTATATTAAAPSPAANSTPPTETAASTAARPAAAAKPADDGARAKALLEGKPAAAASVTAAAPDAKSGRFVVQIGAFLEASAVRDTRAKAEKLGFKTYTQEVDSSTGRRTRVRIGPFATRDEAAQVLNKLKAAELPGVVLTL